MTLSLAQVLPDLCAVDADGPGLVGGWCPACRRHAYPRVARCSACHAALERAVVGRRGRVYSYTVVRTRAPFALPEPYAVGYVDLAESGLRVFALLDPARIDALRIGLPVRLDLQALGVDAAGQPCLRPVFGPDDEVAA